jgi:spartin
MMNSASEMKGVLMQEFPDVQVFQRFTGDSDVQVATGALRVLIVSVPLVDPFSDASSSTAKQHNEEYHDPNDLWLALEIGSDFSLPVKASQTVVPDRQANTYTIPSLDVPGAALVLKIKGGDRDAIRQFENLLTDYCAFPSENKGQGSLELLDDQGQLLGTIDGPWKLTEDPAIHNVGHEKDPVLFELPDQDNPSASGSNQQVLIHAAPRDENGQLPDTYQNDWLLRKAQFLSTSMQKGSAWAGSKMLKGADAYVARTTPPTSNRTSIDAGAKSGSFSEKGQSGMQVQQGTTTSNLTGSGHEVVTFSPQTQNAALKIRDVSGKVCSVSNRTTAALLNAAGNLGSQIGKKTGIQQRATPDGKTETPKGIRGTFNRTLVAANLVLDGLTNSAERLIKDGGEASGRMIEHRYGSEAKVISGNVASVGRSAFVVYKDINGVRRKALLKVATGTIKARAPDGGEVILQQRGTTPMPGNTGAENEKAIGQVEHPPSYEFDGKSAAAGTMTEKKQR